MGNSQVSVYRTIGPLVESCCGKMKLCSAKSFENQVSLDHVHYHHWDAK